MLKKVFMAAVAAFSLFLFSCEAQADEILPVKVVKIPQKGALGFTWKLTAVVYMPPGKGPFPVMIMNHGKDSGPSGLQPDAAHPVPAAVFLARGYAVVEPTRAGFGTSSGAYSESNTMSFQGKQAADSIQAAVEWVQKQPEFDPNRIVLIGQSYGGLGVIAIGQRNLPGIKAIIDFAGGMRYAEARGSEGSDNGPNIQAYKDYGVGSYAPTLLMFADNDSYWGEVSKVPTQMFNAYHQGNPDSELYDEGIADGFDGHLMGVVQKGVKNWRPKVMTFLHAHGLPSEPVYDVLITGIKHDGTRVVVDDAFIRIKPRSGQIAVQ